MSDAAPVAPRALVDRLPGTDEIGRWARQAWAVTLLDVRLPSRHRRTPHHTGGTRFRNRLTPSFFSTQTFLPGSRPVPLTPTG